MSILRSGIHFVRGSEENSQNGQFWNSIYETALLQLRLLSRTAQLPTLITLPILLILITYKKLKDNDVPY
jgi:hypothetical protein